MKTAQIKFWNEGENGNISFDPKTINDFLASQGHGKMYLGELTFTYVRLKNNILIKVDRVKIKNFLVAVLEYCKEQTKEPKYDKILCEFYLYAEQLVSDGKLELLPTLSVKPLADGKDYSYFFFKNTAVKVTKAEIETVAYETLTGKGYINRSQIIDRDFTLSSEDKSEFQQFIKNVTKTEDRYRSLKSAIGYLSHRYQSQTTTKVIILTDEQLNKKGEAHGGTGKGIVAKALGSVRNLVNQDGKSFNATKTFAFQNMDFDTNILCINDAAETFDLEPLYSILTDGLTIEKKYKDPFHIKSSDLPKIMVASNYVVKGKVGYTDERRRMEIEFSNYYGKHLNPEKEFGHFFFSEWSTAEWNKFDNYMLRATQFYLQNGLVEYERVNMEVKRLISQTSQEFYDFAELAILPRINSNEMDKRVMSEYFRTNYQANITPRMFTKWLEQYCELKGITISQRESNSRSYIRFSREVQK